MPTEVVWSNHARRNLIDIYVAIGIDNPDAAERLFSRIDTRTRQLADQPRMGQRRRDIRQSLRVLIESNWLVLYEVHPDTDDGPIDWIEIVAIVDGRRDLGRL